MPECRIQKLLKLLNPSSGLVNLLLCGAEFLPSLLVFSECVAVNFVVLVADHAHRHLRDACEVAATFVLRFDLFRQVGQVRMIFSQTSFYLFAVKLALLQKLPKSGRLSDFFVVEQGLDHNLEVVPPLRQPKVPRVMHHQELGISVGHRWQNLIKQLQV